MPDENSINVEPTTTSRVEDILSVILGYIDNLPQPNSRVEALLIQLKAAIEAGGTADRELAAAIELLKGRCTALEATEILQNTAIAGKMDTSDIVICTAAQYEALEDKTAIEYHIIEE